MKDDKNVHEGHRKRLIELAYKIGFENLTKYQQVEIVLFYAFPRGDVNPLAHRVFDHFGSFSAILDADIDDLISIEGIGRSAALKIKMFAPIFLQYRNSKVENRVGIVTSTDLINVFRDLLECSEVEETVLISLDKAGVCNGVRKIAKGDQRSVGVEIKKIYNFIDSYKSHSIYIGHNHPDGRSACSSGDIDAYAHIKLAVYHYGCQLKDSIVVGSDGVYSMENKRFIYKNPSTSYTTIMEMIKKMKEKN